jgi:hypothetical protein
VLLSLPCGKGAQLAVASLARAPCSPCDIPPVDDKRLRYGGRSLAALCAGASTPNWYRLERRKLAHSPCKIARRQAQLRAWRTLCVHPIVVTHVSQHTAMDRRQGRPVWYAAGIMALIATLWLTRAPCDVSVAPSGFNLVSPTAPHAPRAPNAGGHELAALRRAVADRPPERARMVACAQLRDMTNAAQVWVAFHLLQGFERIVLYDDGSEPPLTAADFGALAEFVTVKRWFNYSGNNDAPASVRHQHISRQWRAYHDCLGSEVGNNSYVAVFDVDEFFWSCDSAVHFADAARALGSLELHMRTCPRFSSEPVFNPEVPIFSQLLYRAPAMPGEPLGAVRGAIPDCVNLKSKDENKGLCFGSTAPKSVFDMRQYTDYTHKYLTIHGLQNKPGLPPAPTPTDATRTRESGLCCNHYFVRDDAEAAWKATTNRNDFYSIFLESEGVRSFYRWKKDTLASDRFTSRVVALLQEAGLPFVAP